MQQSETPPIDDLLVQPLCAVFRKFLKRQGLKFTPERAKILDGVLSKDGVFEAEQLLDEMRRSGMRVSKATIYRTLKHLLDANIITEVLIDSKHAHYKRTFGKEPKGHLVNVDADEITEFDSPELTALAARICREHGYEPLSFNFVIYANPESRSE